MYTWIDVSYGWCVLYNKQKHKTCRAAPHWAQISLHITTVHFSVSPPSTVGIHIVSTARSLVSLGDPLHTMHNSNLFFIFYFFLPSIFRRFRQTWVLLSIRFKIQKYITSVALFKESICTRFFGISYLHRDIEVPHTSTSNKVIFLSLNMKFK